MAGSASNTALLLVLALVGVLAAGAFGCADAALGTLSVARVEELAREGRLGAKKLAVVVADRPRHVNLLLLLRMTCELTATVLVTAVSLGDISPGWLAVLVASVSMVVVSYVLIGVGPRTIGRQHPYAVGLIAAGPVRVLGVVLGPLSRLLISIGNLITPGRGFRYGPFSSEVELRELVDLAGERGVVDEGEREMLHSVFELGDTIAREVMVPRSEIVWIEQSKSVRQALALSLRTGFTRLPVVADSVDDVVGVVNLKDLVRCSLDADANGTTVAELMHGASFVPDTKRLDELLKELQRDRIHLVIVIDEYGGTAGLATIEDILEEIVGEIADEYDTDEVAPVEELGDRNCRVSARLPIEDVGELYDIEFEDDLDVDTVGGLLALELGRVPLPGAEVVSHGLRLRAEEGRDRRGRVRVGTVLLSPVATNGQGEEHDE